MDVAGIICSLIEKRLSDFLLPVLPKNVEVHSMKSATIRNLQLRKYCLSQMGMPLEVVCSKLSSVKVNLKNMTAYGAQVTIDIDGVYLVVSPASSEVMATLTLSKAAALTAEEVRQRLAAELKRLFLKTVGIVNKAITKSMKKVRVSISRMHLKYAHGDGCEVGVVVPHSLLETATPDWRPLSTLPKQSGSEDSEPDVHRRIFCMSNLGVYLSHAPTSATTAAGAAAGASPAPSAVPIPRHVYEGPTPSKGLNLSQRLSAMTARPIKRAWAAALRWAHLTPAQLSHEQQHTVPESRLHPPHGSTWTLKDVPVLQSAFVEFAPPSPSQAASSQPSSSSAAAGESCEEDPSRSAADHVLPLLQGRGNAVDSAPAWQQRGSEWPEWYSPAHTLAADFLPHHSSFLVEPMQYIQVQVSVGVSSQEASTADPTAGGAAAASASSGQQEASALPPTVNGVKVHSFFSLASVNISGSDMLSLGQMASGWLRFSQMRSLAQEAASVPRHLTLLPQRSTLSNTVWTRASNALVRWAVQRRCNAFRQCVADSLGAAYLPLFMKRLLCTRSLHKRLQQLRSNSSEIPTAEFLVGLEPLVKFQCVDSCHFRHTLLPVSSDGAETAGADGAPNMQMWLYMPHVGTSALQHALGSPPAGPDEAGPEQEWQHVLHVCKYLAEGLSDHERRRLIWLESHHMVGADAVRAWRAKAAAILHHIHVAKRVPADPKSAVPSVSKVFSSVAATVAHARGQAVDLSGEEEEEGVCGSPDQPGFAALMNLLVPNFAELAFRAEEISAVEELKVDSSKQAAGCAFKMFKAKSDSGRGPSALQWERTTETLAIPPGGKVSGLFSVPGFQTRDVARRTGAHGIRTLLWFSSAWKKDASSCGLPAMQAEDLTAMRDAQEIVSLLCKTADQAFSSLGRSQAASSHASDSFLGARGVVKAVHSALTKTSSDWLPSSEMEAQQVFQSESKLDLSSARVQAIVSCSAVVLHLRHSRCENWDENIPLSSPRARLVLSPRAPARSAQWSSVASHGPVVEEGSAGAMSGGAAPRSPALQPVEDITANQGGPGTHRPVYASVLFNAVRTNLKIHDSLQHWLFESSAASLRIVCPQRQTANSDQVDYKGGVETLLCISGLDADAAESTTAGGRALFSQLHVQSRASVRPKRVFVQDCGESLWFMHHFSQMQARDARMVIHAGRTDVRFNSRPAAAAIFEAQYLRELDAAWLIYHGTTECIKATNAFEERMKPVPLSGFAEMYNTACRTGVASAHPEQLIALANRKAFYGSPSPTAKLSIVCSGIRITLGEAPLGLPSEETCKALVCDVGQTGIHLSSFRYRQETPKAGTRTTLPQVADFWARSSQDVLGEACIRISSLTIPASGLLSRETQPEANASGQTDAHTSQNEAVLFASALRLDFHLHSRPDSCEFSAPLRQLSMGEVTRAGQRQKEVETGTSSHSHLSVLSCAAFIEDIRSSANLAQLRSSVELLAGLAETCITTVAAPLIAADIKLNSFGRHKSAEDISAEAPRRVNLVVLALLRRLPDFLTVKLGVGKARSELLFGSPTTVKAISSATHGSMNCIFSLNGCCMDVALGEAELQLQGASQTDEAQHEVAFMFKASLSAYLHCIPQLIFVPWKQVSVGLHQLNRDRSGSTSSQGLAALTLAAKMANVSAQMRHRGPSSHLHVDQMVAPFTSAIGMQVVHSSKEDANSAPLVPRSLRLPGGQGINHFECSHVVQSAIEEQFGVTDGALREIERVAPSQLLASGELYFGTCALIEFQLSHVHMHASPQVFARLMDKLARIVIHLISFARDLGKVLGQRATSIQQVVQSLLKPPSAPTDPAGTGTFVDIWRSAAFAVNVHLDRVTGVLLSDTVYGEAAKQLLQVCVTNVSLLAEYGTHPPGQHIPVMRTGATIQVLVLAETEPRWVEVIAPFAVTSRTSYSLQVDDGVNELVLSTSVATLSDVQLTLSPGVLSKFLEAANGINGLVATLSGLLAAAQRSRQPGGDDRAGTHSDAKTFEPFYITNALGYDLSYEHDHPMLRSNRVLLDAHLGRCPEHQAVALSLEGAPEDSSTSTTDVNPEHIASEPLQSVLDSEIDALRPRWARLSMGDELGERADERYAILGQQPQQAAASIVQHDPCLSLRMEGCSVLRGANIAQYDNRLRFVRALPSGAGGLGTGGRIPFLWQVQRHGSSKNATAASLIRFHNHAHRRVELSIKQAASATELSCSVEQLTMVPLPFYLASCEFQLKLSIGDGSVACSNIPVSTGSTEQFSCFLRTVQGDDGPQVMKVWIHKTPIYMDTCLINIHVCPAVSLANYFSMPLMVQWRNKALPAEARSTVLQPKHVVALESCVSVPDRDECLAAGTHNEPLELRFAAVSGGSTRNWSLWSDIGSAPEPRSPSKEFIQVWGQCPETVICQSTQHVSTLTGQNHKVGCTQKMSHLHLKRWSRLPASVDDVPGSASGLLLSISAPFALHNATEETIALQSVWPASVHGAAAALGADAASASAQLALNWMAETSLATAALLPPGEIAAGLSFEASHTEAQVPHLAVERSAWNGMFAGNPATMVGQWMALPTLASNLRIRAASTGDQKSFLSEWSLSDAECIQLSTAALAGRALPSSTNLVNLDCNATQSIRLESTGDRKGRLDYVLHPLMVEQETSLATVENACTTAWVLSPQFVVRNDSEFTLVVAQVSFPAYLPKAGVADLLKDSAAVIIPPRSARSWHWSDAIEPPFASAAFCRLSASNSGAAAGGADGWEVLSSWSTPVALHDFRDSSCLVRDQRCASDSGQRVAVSVRASHISVQCAAGSNDVSTSVLGSSRDLAVAELSDTQGMTRQFSFSLDSIPAVWQPREDGSKASSYTTCIVNNATRELYLMRPFVDTAHLAAAQSLQSLDSANTSGCSSLDALAPPENWLQEQTNGRRTCTSFSSELCFLIRPGSQRVVVPTGIGSCRGLFAVHPVSQPSAAVVSLLDAHDLAVLQLPSSRNQAGLSAVGGSAAGDAAVSEFSNVSLACINGGFLGFSAARQEAMKVSIRTEDGTKFCPSLPKAQSPQFSIATKLKEYAGKIAGEAQLPTTGRLQKLKVAGPPELHPLHMQPLFLVKVQDADYLSLEMHSVALSDATETESGPAITFGSKVLVCAKALIAPSDTTTRVCALEEQVFALRGCRSGGCVWEPLPHLLAPLLDPQAAPPAGKVNHNDIKLASKCVFIVGGGQLGAALQASASISMRVFLVSAYYQKRVLHFGSSGPPGSSVTCCELQQNSSDSSSASGSPNQATAGVFSGWTVPSWQVVGPAAGSATAVDSSIDCSILPGNGWNLHQGSLLELNCLEQVLPTADQRVHLLRSGMDGSAHTLTIRSLDIEQAVSPAEHTGVRQSESDLALARSSAVSIQLGVAVPSLTVSLHSPSAAELARVHVRGISTNSSLTVPSLLQLLPIDWLMSSLQTWSGSVADSARQELRKAMGDSSVRQSSMFAPSQRWLQAVLAAVRPMLISVCKQLPRQSRARLLESCNVPSDPSESQGQTALSVIQSMLQPSPFSKTALAIVKGDLHVADLRLDDPREDGHYSSVLQWQHAGDDERSGVINACVTAHYSPAALQSTTSISMDQNVLHLPLVQLSVQPLKLQLSTAFVQALTSQFVVPSIMAAPAALESNNAGESHFCTAPPVVGIWWASLQQGNSGSGWGLQAALGRRLHVDALQISGISISVTIHASTHHTRSFLLEGEKALADLGLVAGAAQSSSATSWANTSFLRNKQSEQGLAISLLRGLQSALSSLGIALVPVAATLGALVATVSSVSDSVLPLRPLNAGGFMTAKSIAQQMATHLTSELIWSLHNILLNIDILGKPVVVVRRLSQGTLDLFTRPAAGLRALSLIETLKGLGTGSASFAGGVFSGVGTAASAISTSLGRGAAALTFDDDFLKQRVADSRRKGHEVSKFGMWSRQVQLASMKFALADSGGLYMDAKAARIWSMLQLAWASRHLAPHIVTNASALRTLKDDSAGEESPSLSPAVVGRSDSDSSLHLPTGFEDDSTTTGDQANEEAQTIQNLLMHSAVQQYAVLTLGVCPLDGPAFASLARFLSKSPSFQGDSLLAVRTMAGMHDLIQQNLGDSTLRAPRTNRVAGIGNPNTSALPLFAGIAHGAMELSSGLVHGVTGLVTQPVKGFLRNNSAGGLLGGVLRGVAGVVVRPTVGALDAVTRVGEGIAAMGDSAWLTAVRAKLVPESTGSPADISSAAESALSSVATAVSQADAIQQAVHWWRGTALGAKHLSPNAADDSGAAWHALYTVEQHALAGAAKQGFAVYDHALWLWIREQHPQKLRWGYAPPSLLPLRSEHAFVMWAIKLRKSGVPCGVPVSVGHSVWRRLLPAIKAGTMALSDISKSKKDFKVLKSRKVRVVRVPHQAASHGAAAAGAGSGVDPAGGAAEGAVAVGDVDRSRGGGTSAHQIQTDEAVHAAASTLLDKAAPLEPGEAAGAVHSGGAGGSGSFASHTRKNAAKAKQYLKQWRPAAKDSEYYFEGDHVRHLIVPSLSSFVADPYMLVKRLTMPAEAEVAARNSRGEAHGEPASVEQPEYSTLPHLFVFVATRFEIMLVEYGSLRSVLASRACSISSCTQHDLDMPVMQLCWSLPFDGPAGSFHCLACIARSLEYGAASFLQSVQAEDSSPVMFPSPAGSIAPSNLARAAVSQPPSQQIAYFDTLVQQSLSALSPLLDAPLPVSASSRVPGTSTSTVQQSLAMRFFQHGGPTQDALTQTAPFAKAIQMLGSISLSLHPSDNAILLQAAVSELTASLSREVNRGSERHITLDADDIMPSFGVLLARANPQHPLLVAALLGGLAQHAGARRSALQECLDNQLGENSLRPVLDANQVDYSANMLASFGAVAVRMGSLSLATGEFPALCWPLQQRPVQCGVQEAADVHGGDLDN